MLHCTPHPTPPPHSFNKLYTLEGGIQNYMRTEGLDHWNGSLFVFDGRMAIRPSERWWLVPRV